MIWYFAAGFAGGFMGAGAALFLLYWWYVAGDDDLIKGPERPSEHWSEGAFHDGGD